MAQEIVQGPNLKMVIHPFYSPWGPRLSIIYHLIVSLTPFKTTIIQFIFQAKLGEFQHFNARKTCVLYQNFEMVPTMGGGCPLPHPPPGCQQTRSPPPTPCTAIVLLGARIDVNFNFIMHPKPGFSTPKSKKVPHRGRGIPPPPGGGGGYFHNAYWICAARETPNFSPEFPFRSISFHKLPKNPLRPEHHHFTYFGGFAAASWQFRRFAFSRSKRLKLVPEPRIFKLKTAQARSGAPHFHAQPGARSGREPWPIFHFAAAHIIPTNIWGEYPPPPGALSHTLPLMSNTLLNNLKTVSPTPCAAIIIHFQL